MAAVDCKTVAVQVAGFVLHELIVAQIGQNQ